MPSTKNLTQEQFLEKAAKAQPNTRYSFEKADYINCRSPVTVICPEHGEFQCSPRSIFGGVKHLCRQCTKVLAKARLTQAQFIEKANKIHNNFYSYNKTIYTVSRATITITCPIHGDFEQWAGGHLEGYGCRKCGDQRHGDYRPWYITTYFDRFPSKKDLPATLYLLYNREENFYKVGITTVDINERIKYTGYSFEILDTVETTMYNAAVAEQQILQEYKSLRHYPKRKFGGYSECLSAPVDIQKYVPKEAR